MASERKLTVVLAGDVKGFTSAVDTAQSKVGGFKSKVGGLSTGAKLAFAGAATAAVGFAKTSVDAFVEAEQSQARLDDAFKKFPQLAGSNADAIRDLNRELALKTRFDDDATASAQATLAQFGLTEDQLKKVTPLVQDYAAKTGKDLVTAATDVGKATLGQGRAFKSVGLNLKDTGSQAGNLEQVMGGLQDKVGGFATKEGKTAAGQAAILKNQFGELQETVGSHLVPALLTMAKFLTEKVFPVLGDIGSWFKEHKPVLIAVASVIGVGLVAAFVAWATAAASAAAATIAATWPILAIGAAIAALVAGIIWAYQNWGFFRTAVDAVATFFTDTLWPILKSVAGWITGTLIPTIGNIIGTFIDWGKTVGEVAGKIIGFVAGVIDWVKRNWPLILAILTGPIGLAVLAIQRNWDTIKNGVTAVKDWIVGRFNDAVNFLSGIGYRISLVMGGVADIIKTPFRLAFQGIKTIWNSTVGGFGFEVPGWVPGVGGKSFHIPEMHTGGIFGEDEGPAILKRGEGVFTPGQMAAMAPAGGGDIHVTVDMRGSVGLSGPAVEKWVRDAVVNAVNRDGRIPGTNIAKAVP